MRINSYLSKVLAAACVLVFFSESGLRGQSSIRHLANSSITAPIKFVKLDSLKIAYKIIGSGAPIIFLQRFRGNLNDWDPGFVDLVSKQYKVILFDAPGIGSSSGSVPTSMTKMADQAVAFAHAIGIERATYLGWSMGGAIAQVVAIEHPQNVTRLILLATGPAGNPDSEPANPEFRERAVKNQYGFDDYQFLFFYSSRSSKEACQSFLQRTSKYKMQDAPVKEASFKNQSVASADFKANKESNYFEGLRTIKVPVLIANGKYDPSYPIRNAYVLEREINNAKLILYPDAGHGFLFQFYRQFSNEVIKFLKSKE